MTANPLTDQLAEHARTLLGNHTCTGSGCELHEYICAVAADLCGALPDHDPVTIGAIAMHVADIFAGAYKHELACGRDSPTAAAVASNMISLAGSRLYNPEPVTGLPDPNGGEPT